MNIYVKLTMLEIENESVIYVKRNLSDLKKTKLHKQIAEEIGTTG